MVISAAAAVLVVTITIGCIFGTATSINAWKRAKKQSYRPSNWIEHWIKFWNERIKRVRKGIIKWSAKTISGSMKRGTEWNIIIIFFDVVDQCHELSKWMWSNIVCVCVYARVFIYRSVSLILVCRYSFYLSRYLIFILFYSPLLLFPHHFNWCLYIELYVCVCVCHWNGGGMRCRQQHSCSRIQHHHHFCVIYG